MHRSIVLFYVASVLATQTHLHAQQADAALQPPAAGFNVRGENIPAGKKEIITYHSPTVGVDRKMLIYTPPGYSKFKSGRDDLLELIC